LACGVTFDIYKRRLEAAHILEIKEKDTYSQEEFGALLQFCGIVALEDCTNLISLCNICHNEYFDKQLIGINTDEEGRNYSWIVNDTVFNNPLPYSNNGSTYGDINGKIIDFEYVQQRPPLNLVLHRLKRFKEAGTSSKRLFKKRVGFIIFL
jgi:hypothetical protein